MTRFAGLEEDLPRPGTPVTRADSAAADAAKKRTSRDGKKGILGHFSPELSRALNIMAINEDTTVQALMGEAFDLLMRERGKHPFGER